MLSSVRDVLLDDAVEFFLKGEQIAPFDSKTTDAFWPISTERQAGGGSAMDLFPVTFISEPYVRSLL
jgi:hypothetical protein